jgi:hypothetical protein
MWQCTPVNPSNSGGGDRGIMSLRSVCTTQQVQVSLSYIVRPCLKLEDNNRNRTVLTLGQAYTEITKKKKKHCTSLLILWSFVLLNIYHLLLLGVSEEIHFPSREKRF